MQELTRDPAAQLDWTRVRPVLDDVMGELDLKRRSGLLPLLERSDQARGQVFMTCTEENWPRELGARLQRWRISAGSLLPFGSS